MEKKGYKRRNYFIDKGAQSKFMAAFTAASLLAALIAAITFVYLAQSEIERTIYKMRLPETTMANLFLEEMVITTVVGIVVIALLFSFTMGKIFVRMEGPLIKLSNLIQRIKDGDLREEVALREKDEFQNFAASIDEMTGNLRNSLRVIKKNSYELSKLGTGAGEGQADLVRDSREHVQALKKELESFKL